MNLIADLHTHTLYSDHAFNTVTEMITQAQKLGLKALAITDHGPAMPDSGHHWHYINKGQIPKKIGDMIVMFGIEADVMNVQAELDISDGYLGNLDWVIASIHKDIIPKLSFEDATQLWLNVARNPYVDMIGHCEQVEHYFDYEKVIPVFAANNKVVEMNVNSAIVRPTGQKNMEELAKACKKYGCKIAVNSDAHSIYTIGQQGNVPQMLERIDFPQELIINASCENLIKELKIHNKKFLSLIEV
ncbi:MAG: phosphatase [Oscillospiraceae bacterium]|nr:phosphatase [Oscillospiraceae bacterium]